MDLYKSKILHYLSSLKAFGYEFHDPIAKSPSSNCATMPVDINILKKQIHDCSLCDLSKSRKNLCFGYGNLNSKIIFVSDSPGIIEDETGNPFEGKSGELLEKIINTVLGVDKSEFFYTNLSKCKTPNNRLPTNEEIASCKPYLLQQIASIKPKLIVVLGEIPAKYLCGYENSSSILGKIIQFSDEIHMICTYHPSYLLRNPSAKKDSFEDFKTISKFISSNIS